MNLRTAVTNGADLLILPGSLGLGIYSGPTVSDPSRPTTCRIPKITCTPDNITIDGLIIPRGVWDKLKADWDRLLRQPKTFVIQEGE